MSARTGCYNDGVACRVGSKSCPEFPARVWWEDFERGVKPFRRASSVYDGVNLFCEHLTYPLKQSQIEAGRRWAETPPGPSRLKLTQGMITCGCRLGDFKTYEEWLSEGEPVSRGQKSLGRREDGKHLFCPHQTGAAA